MKLRDKLNSDSGYQEIVEQNLEFITEDKERIKELLNDESNGVEKYPKKNLEIIHSIEEGIPMKYFENLLANFSMGDDVENIKKIYFEVLSSLKYWKQSNGYVQMVNMLSLGILLDIEDPEFSKLVELVKKDNPNDFLIDFLIKNKVNSWTQHEDFKFPKPYKATKEIVELAQVDKGESIEKLKKYFKSWYNSIEIKTHTSKFNIHTGYWCFESGALVKILGLDDVSLKDQQYYPYDLVHWKG